MSHKHIVKLIELEGQTFDELLKQQQYDEAIAVIKRQCDLWESHIKKHKYVRHKSLEEDQEPPKDK